MRSSWIGSPVSFVVIDQKTALNYYSQALKISVSLRWSESEMRRHGPGKMIKHVLLTPQHCRSVHHVRMRS